MSRPDLTFCFAASSQVNTADSAAPKRLNKIIEIAKKNHDLGLSFISLDVGSLRLAVFADASFASNAYSISQLGFVICSANKLNKADIVHSSSSKTKRVTRSVKTAELFAVAHAIDFASTMRTTISSMMENNYR